MGNQTSVPPHAQPAPAPAGRGWIVALALASVGIFAAWFGPLQILLPEQARVIAEQSSIGKESLLATVTGIGALVSMVCNPLWGYLSDRIKTPVGKRVPVAIAGTVLGICGLVVLYAAESGPVLVLGWAIVQAGFNGPFAAFTALIADRVPQEQRGVVGALFGVGQIAGVVAGTAVATVVGAQPVGYLALAVAAPTLMAALVITSARGDLAAGGATRSGAEVPTFAQNSVEAVDSHAFTITAQFAWAWLMRFLMNVVNAVVLLYLYYYLVDQIGIAEPADYVLIITLVSVLLSAIFAAVGGFWSDKLSRRRVFVVGGALAMALGAALLGVVSTVATTIAAGAIVGVGWGLYLAVDIAIITAVLPAQSSAATMLGVANVASSLPQVLVPLIAAPIVTGFAGYFGFYAVGVLAALLAIGCVRMVTVLR